MKSNLKCEVVQDLLPGYVDKITSEVTNTEIAEHLSECDPCTSTYEAMKMPDKVKPVENKKDIRFLAKIMKKILIRTAIFVFAAVVLVVLLYAGAKGLRELRHLPTSETKIEDVYLLSNGEVICKVVFSDNAKDYVFSGFSFQGGEKGEDGVTIFRSGHYYTLADKWFHSGKYLREDPTKGFAYMLYPTNNLFSIKDGVIETKGDVKIYYQGKDGNDAILVWQTGDPIELAPKELEDYASVNLPEYDYYAGTFHYTVTVEDEVQLQPGETYAPPSEVSTSQNTD